MVAAVSSKAEAHGSPDHAQALRQDEEDVRASVSVAGPIGEAKASLLVGWNLEGKTVVVVGSSDLAAFRASIALAARPSVLRIVTGGLKPSATLSDFVDSTESHAHVHVSLETRHLLPNVDLSDSTALVLCAVEDAVTSKRVVSLCAHRRIPINVAGHPELSSFRLLGGIQDGSVQIGVTGNGVGGVDIVNKIRATLEKQLPHGLGKAAENIDKLRDRLEGHSTESSGLEEHLSHIIAKSSLASLALASDAELTFATRSFARGEEPQPLRSSREEVESDSATETGSDGEVETTTKFTASSSSSKAVVNIVKVAPDVSDIGHIDVHVYEAIVDADLVAGPTTLSTEYQTLVSGDLLSVRPGRADSARSVVVAAASKGVKVTWIVVDHHDAEAEDVRSWLEGEGVTTKIVSSHHVHVEPVVAKVVPPTPTPSVHKASPAVTPTRPKVPRKGTRTIATATEAIEHVATLVSDVVLVTGSTRVAQLVDSVNIRGLPATVISLPTRTSSGAAIHGVASAGASVAALVQNLSLPFMVDGLAAMVHGRNAGVLHVETKGVGEVLGVKADFSGVWEAAHVGAAVVVGGSLEEVYDMAIAAHLASNASGTPFINAYDGSFLASEKKSFLALPAADIRHITEVYDRDHATSGTVSDVEAAFSALQKSSGRSYKSFEYIGHPKAELVIVALSVDATAVEAAVHKVVSTGHKVGLVKARLLSPWASEHFAEALPHSAQRVAVVDPSRIARNVGAAHGYVFAYVATSVQNRKSINLYDVKVENGIELNPGVAEKLFSIVAKAAPHHRTIVVDSDIATGAPTSPYSPEGLHQAIFFDIEAKGSQIVAEHAVHRLYSAGSETVAFHASVDALVPEPAVRTDLRFGHGDSPSLPVFAADYIAFHDSRLVAAYDSLSSLKHRGHVLVNATWTSLEEIEKDLTGEVLKTLAAKEAQLYIVDADKIAQAFTQFVGDKKTYAHIILEGLFYHFGTSHPQENVEALISRIHETFDHFGVRRSLVRAVRKAIKVAHKVAIPATWGRIHVQDKSVPFSQSVAQAGAGSLNNGPHVSTWFNAGWKMVFSEAFGVKYSLRPDVGDAHSAVVSERIRVTPDSYDRNIFHMEVDLAGSGLTYNGLGEALGVYAHNDPEEVAHFLNEYGVHPHEIVETEQKSSDGNTVIESRTAEQVFGQVLDIFGRPGKGFYKDLSSYAKDLGERNKLSWLGSADGAHEFDRRAELTVTFADILREFKTARPSLGQLVQLIPPIKTRAYSIASAASMHPTKVHLLIVLVDWTDGFGRPRQGQATRYLSNLKPGQRIAVSIKPSIMKLPASPLAPVVMSGLGTGMAPFRTFIQARAVQKHSKQSVGPMTLYFGARHRSQEYLYGEEMDAWHEDGLLTHLRLAFSRDQKKKVYIQHKMHEDAEMLYNMLVKQKGSFYLCGPVWPVPDVTEAILRAFEHGGLSRAQAEAYLEEMKEEERFVLEVY